MMTLVSLYIGVVRFREMIVHVMRRVFVVRVVMVCA